MDQCHLNKTEISNKKNFVYHLWKKAGPWCVLEEGSKGPKIGFCDVPDCPDGMQANGAFHTSSYNMHGKGKRKDFV